MKEKMIEKKHKESIRDRQGTLVIIFINIVLYIAINIIPSLGEKLLLNSEIATILERPWTLVTVFFSHEVHVHIIINMVVFFFFGSRLEKITNAKTVAIVYLIAGLIGSLAFPLTASMIQPTGLAAGASAAVLGIVAVFAVMRPSAVILGSKAQWWLVMVFVFSILSAVITPQTLDSDVAHITGMLVGVVSGYYLKNNEKINL